MSFFSPFVPSFCIHSFFQFYMVPCKKKKKKCAFEGGDALEMLVSCTELTSASPSSAYLFLKGTRPAVIILSLPMNGELYMMLQARSESSATGHIWIIWWPLFEHPGCLLAVIVPAHVPPTLHAGSALLELVSNIGA